MSITEEKYIAIFGIDSELSGIDDVIIWENIIIAYK